MRYSTDWRGIKRVGGVYAKIGRDPEMRDSPRKFDKFITNSVIMERGEREGAKRQSSIRIRPAVCAEASQGPFETLTGACSHSMALYEMIFETLTDLIAVLTMGWQVGMEGGGMGWPWPHAMQVHQSADAGR